MHNININKPCLVVTIRRFICLIKKKENKQNILFVFFQTYAFVVLLTVYLFN